MSKSPWELAFDRLTEEQRLDAVSRYIQALRTDERTWTMIAKESGYTARHIARVRSKSTPVNKVLVKAVIGRRQELDAHQVAPAKNHFTNTVSQSGNRHRTHGDIMGYAVRTERFASGH